MSKPKDLVTSTTSRAAAYKTVDIFSGLTGRNLLLVNGAVASTDLTRIMVPFDSPSYYEDIEHELAHILFKSDPIAVDSFVSKYVSKAAKAVQSEGIVLDKTDEARLHGALSTVVGITEDHRVNSLWGMIYPGSYKIIREQDREYTKAHLPNAHNALVTLYLLVANGHDPDPGSLDRYRVFCIEALRKVERRGFSATLMVSKWLFSCFISEMIRALKGVPETKCPDGYPKTRPDLSGDRAEPNLNLPVEEGSQNERAKAMSELPQLLGYLPADLEDRVNDVKAPTVRERGSAEKAEESVAQALRLNIHDKEEVEAVLNTSQVEMEAIVRSVLDSFSGTSLSYENWVRKEVGARVVFKDVRERDVSSLSPAPMLMEDLRTVEKLRSLFHRVMGKRATCLDDAGYEIDVASYMEYLTTKRTVPFFRRESSGRGFHVLILLDRSGSMGGLAEATERACRIIARALKYPFVRLDLWGWNALDKGQIDIARYDPRLEVFTSPKSLIGGTTPLHLAVKVGQRFMEGGAEAKHMIVTTDGEPVYQDSENERYYHSSQSLMEQTRDNVREARRRGVRVSGLIFGNGVTDQKMSMMFGSKGWTRVRQDHLAPDLVRFVVACFLKYLSEQ